MIEIKTNINKAFERIIDRLPQPDTTDKMLRTIAQNVFAEMKQRIHKSGLDSSGAPIGDYSRGYLYTRVKNNRGTSTKVIISLTRQMENDMKVIATDKGYGIGYSNPDDFDKVAYVENTYGKKIFDLTQAEKNIVKDTATEFIKNLQNG